MSTHSAAVAATAAHPSAVPPAASRSRLPSLTGLRFFAALLVVLYHLSRLVGRLPVVSDLAWYGRSGVTFFFVLSGFVLAWTYDGRTVPVTVFLWRRFARIWPLFAVTTALSVGAWLVIGTAVSGRAVGVSLLLVHAWVPVPVIYTGGNPAGWSLSDETWFYLLFPLLLVLLARGGRRAWFGVAVATVLLGVLVWLAGDLVAVSATRSWALDYLPLSRTPQFVLGVVAGLAVRRGWRPPVSFPLAAALVLGWLVLLVPWSAAVSDSLWYSPYSASQLLSAPLFALLVCAAAHADERGQRTGVAGRRAVRLGQWSFAWYLVHEIVIRVLAHEFTPGSRLGVLGVWLAALVLSQALAAACYEWIEHPVERRLRPLVRARTAPPTVAAAVPTVGSVTGAVTVPEPVLTSAPNEKKSHT